MSLGRGCSSDNQMYADARQRRNNVAAVETTPAESAFRVDSLSFPRPGLSSISTLDGPGVDD